MYARAYHAIIPTIMRKIILCLFALCALGLSAQVTTSPNPIPVGYTGQITITFDATKGNAGMKGATKCYAHTGYCTASASWLGVVGGTWRSANAPQLTNIGTDLWQLIIPNMFTFYGVAETTPITKLAFVFHDGNGGSKEGKTSAGGDIYVTLGEETVGDIWEGFTPAAVTTQARPNGVTNGIYYDASDPTKVTLCTFAASKTQPAKHVFVLGDMTGWKLNNEYQMKRDGDFFWITLTGLTPGKEYRFQYAIERADGVKKQICDLYSEKVLHPDDQWEPKQMDPTLIDYPTSGADGGYVTVIQTNKPQFQWSSATLNFQRPDKENLVIYEVWPYDYTTKRNFNGLKERLDYIQNLGVNAIELMPVSEFEGNQSWGYNPTLYFALDKAYGTPNQLKSFIDECHKRGIAVIVDMVFNHTKGPNPMAKLYPYGTDLQYNPWFNTNPPEGDNGYGEEWDHDFQPAHEMFTRVFKYWLQEYKVDGFRLDLSHGLCGQTNNAVQNLKDYYDNGVKAVSQTAYMILEHWGNGQDQLINYGMLCWTGEALCNAYCQAAMGWLKDGDDFTVNNGNRKGYVSYCESHDEERMQYKAKTYGNGTIKTDEATRLGRVPACVAFNVLLRGPHMLWQFEEIGYDISIEYNGRTGSKPNPSTKGWFAQPNRVKAFTKCAQVIALRTQLMPNAFTGAPTVNIGSGVKVRTIQWGSNVFAVANFDVNTQAISMPSGTWYDYLNGAARATVSTCVLEPGELKVFTATPVVAPVFSDIQKRDNTAVELVDSDEAPKSAKILLNGQIYILRGDKIYDLNGRLVR